MIRDPVTWWMLHLALRTVMPASNVHNEPSRVQLGNQRVNPGKRLNRQRKPRENRGHGEKNANIACSPNMISSIEISEGCNLNSTDKSLTELLATNNVTSNATSSPSQSAGRTKDTLNDQIRELQKCVSDLSKQNSSLQSQIDLLEFELENLKKMNKTSKSEIKRKTKDNDNLRQKLSRIKGLRKYTNDQNATEKMAPISVIVMICKQQIQNWIACAFTSLMSHRRFSLSLVSSEAKYLQLQRPAINSSCPNLPPHPKNPSPSR